MQNKYKLPDDVKQTVLSYIKGYDRRLKQYLSMRSDILNSSPCNFAEYTAKFTDKNKKEQEEVRRQYFGHGSLVSNPTPDKAASLDELEAVPEVRRMRAVEQAKLHIGNDIQNDEVREKLKTAIWYNCLAGREYPYEVWDLPTIDRNGFYKIKGKFLFEIAQHESLI